MKQFMNEDGTPFSKEQFIEKIKTDQSFAERFGNLGPIYGKQWRGWSADDKHFAELRKPIDQIANLISELKKNPDSRRLMVNAWNVSELDQMVLPPCHYGFQVWTRELTLEEKIKWVMNNTDVEMENVAITERAFDPSTPNRAISLMWNQRSVDTFLGLPFNIASYGLLLEIIAREVNMVAEELIGNLGDTHLYLNHIEQAKEQISREPMKLPAVTINERNWYLHEKVKQRLGEKTFAEKIVSYRPEDFTLHNYQSHPAIKAPLSN